MLPKTTTLDIETSPRIGLFFGNEYKAQISKTIQESYVFGFAWKPLHKKVQSCWIWDFPLYKKDPTNDIEVVKKWIEVVSDLDIVIGQNSRTFDDKVMMGRVMMHHLDPPTPFATVDTMADTKRVARYDSNKLDYVSKQYGFGGKQDTGGIDLWWDCLDVPGFKKGDPKAQKKMVRYCEHDVILTEKRYDWERPYYKNHPAVNVFIGRPKACPHCGQENMIANIKYRATSSLLYQYFRCSDCGGTAKARIPEPLAKTNKVQYKA